MSETVSRRQLLAATSVAVSGITGCSALGSGDRVLNIAVINNSERHHTIELTVYVEGKKLVSQYIEVTERDVNSPISNTIVSTEVTQGAEVSVGVLLNGDTTVEKNYSIECGEDMRGDQITMRIHAEDYVSISHGCVGENEGLE